MQDKMNGKKPLRDEYGRFSNPTQRAAEGKIAALEGGERALLFASGMCAITTTLLALLESGDHLIMPRDGFYITRDFARALLAGGDRTRSSRLISRKSFGIRPTRRFLPILPCIGGSGSRKSPSNTILQR
jgi:hypothetical protein